MAKQEFSQKIDNRYNIAAKHLSEYTAFRGVTDFTQLAQFDPYEKGYSFLCVISLPKFMEELAKQPENVGKRVDTLCKNFKHILEFEFKGLEGLNDIQAETMQITDGINEIQLINKVTQDMSAQVTMEYVEKRGSTLEKFAEIYLTGIHDPHTQAKTYHGLIANGKMAPGVENEVFTMMYINTDSTMLQIERAFLLCNMQLTRAEKGTMYTGTRADIGAQHTVNLEFNCYPVSGFEVDKAAAAILTTITGVNPIVNANKLHPNDGSIDGTYVDANGITRNVAKLDSSDYKYGILGYKQGTTQYKQQSETSQRLQAYSKAANSLGKTDTPNNIDNFNVDLSKDLSQASDTNTNKPALSSIG